MGSGVILRGHSRRRRRGHGCPRKMTPDPISSPHILILSTGRASPVMILPVHDSLRAHITRLLSTLDRKSTRLNSSHSQISYAVFCLKKKKTTECQLHSNSTTVLRY